MSDTTDQKSHNRRLEFKGLYRLSGGVEIKGQVHLGTTQKEQGRGSGGVQKSEETVQKERDPGRPSTTPYHWDTPIEFRYQDLWGDVSVEGRGCNTYTNGSLGWEWDGNEMLSPTGYSRSKVQPKPRTLCEHSPFSQSSSVSGL